MQSLTRLLPLRVNFYTFFANHTLQKTEQCVTFAALNNGVGNRDILSLASPCYSYGSDCLTV